MRTNQIAALSLGFVLAASHLASPQSPTAFPVPPLPTENVVVKKPKKLLDQYPEKPSLPPAFTIPVAPLGFLVPGDNYLLRKQSLVSLDFLDEDRILFTFRISGLLERNVGNEEGNAQQIRAVVLSASTGKPERWTTWVVPDRSRYLWMLNDGNFLLRVREGLDVGDSHLNTVPGLRLPGLLLWIEMDPSQQFLIANSLEPDAVAQSDLSGPDSKGAQSTDLAGRNQPTLVARTLRRQSGEVIRTNRFTWTSQKNDWPMNSEGYLERLRDGDHWELQLDKYAGGSRNIARVDSTCLPRYSFLSDTKILVNTCSADSGWRLAALSTSGQTLWETRTATNAIFPLLVSSSNGERFARQTLVLKRTVDHYKGHVSAIDLKGQMVRIFNATDGKPIMESPLTPVLDGGGNVAFSPSGNRLAILNAAAIQIFQLPPSTASNR